MYWGTEVCMGKKAPIASVLYEGITLIAPNYSKYVLQKVERERWKSDFERRVYELKHRLRVELHELEEAEQDWFRIGRQDLLYRLYRKARRDGETATRAYYRAVEHLALRDAA